MLNRFTLFIGVCALFLAPGAAVAAPDKAPAGAERTVPWNAETSDLEPDASIIYGRLPNGLRYAIRPNNRPQNQVLVRMALDFGSAAEADNEQGLAHFIEHMAFNGTTHVPEGEMVKMLERLGLSFGADTNASTGYTQTQYKLDLPKAEPMLIERALFLMRETASEIIFDPAAVDRERGVVISEMRLRENFGFQSSRAANALFYPDTYYSTRYPIGTLAILQNAPAERMKALYRKYYRPDRARIVVVGPVDPAIIERQIVAKFSDWKSNGPPLGDIDQCTIHANRPPAADIFIHPEINEGISIQQVVADVPRPDTVNRALMELRMQIAGAIISQRISRRSREADIPFLGGGLSFSTGFCNEYARLGISASGKDGSWRELLTFVEQIVRQAAEHGFSDAEIAEQVQRLNSAYDNAAKGEATRPSSAFANELVAIKDDIVNSAAYRQLLWIQLRPFMSNTSVHAEFVKWHRKFDAPSIFLTTKNGDGIDGNRLLASYNQSRAIAVAAPEARNEHAFAYTDFGQPGEIVEDRRIADLGIRKIRFANNVLLNIKKTDFEDNRVRYSVRIDGGELHFGKENAALARLMESAYISGGLEAHDIEDLRSLLAGTTVATAFNVAEDYFGTYGSVAPTDLDRQMQVLAAYTRYPAYRADALRLFRRPLPEIYATLDATPGSALGVASARIMNEGDPRFALEQLETILKVDFDMLKPALGDALISNRLEIALVGDVDEDAAIASVARSFGALPTRRLAADVYAAARTTRWATARGNFDIPHKGELNQLGWRRVWTTTGDIDQRTTQTMDLLARMVTLRLIDELREKLGASYGGSANSAMSKIYTGRGTFSVSTNGDPKDLAAIEAAVDEIIAELIAAPADRDLFERARKPVLESYADWRKRNDTWIGIVSEAQSNPDRLDRFRNSEARFTSITPDDVWKLAKQYLARPAQFTFRALPERSIIAEAGNSAVPAGQ
ncbi:MAG: insulinase family protein [Sphingorhabdus sp.]